MAVSKAHEDDICAGLSQASEIRPRVTLAGLTTRYSEVAMKVQATVLLSFQSKSLAEAGALVDDILARARERDDVDVGRVELLSPPSDRVVSLPPTSTPVGYAPQVPHSASVGDGA
jgi:hypothetical protein